VAHRSARPYAGVPTTRRSAWSVTKMTFALFWRIELSSVSTFDADDDPAAARDSEPPGSYTRNSVRFVDWVDNLADGRSVRAAQADHSALGDSHFVCPQRGFGDWRDCRVVRRRSSTFSREPDDGSCLSASRRGRDRPTADGNPEVFLGLLGGWVAAPPSRRRSSRSPRSPEFLSLRWQLEQN